jgi:hypothetical protein
MTRKGIDRCIKHLYHDVCNILIKGIKEMDGEINKFDQISNIYSQFSEKNKENLVKTAKSLLKIQNVNEAMLAGKPPVSVSLSYFVKDGEKA